MEDSRHGMIEVSCITCNNGFLTYPSRLKVGKGKYCSHSCSAKDTMVGNKRAVGSKGWVGKRHSEASKEKMRQANLGKRYSPKTQFVSGLIPWNKGREWVDMSGENHWNWQGGITKAHTKIRNSLEYKQWRTAVFERDNFTCVECLDSSGGNLNADHIKQFAYYPELRFDVDNGRTLCVDCHKKTDTYLNAGRWRSC